MAEYQGPSFGHSVRSLDPWPNWKTQSMVMLHIKCCPHSPLVDPIAQNSFFLKVVTLYIKLKGMKTYDIMEANSFFDLTHPLDIWVGFKGQYISFLLIVVLHVIISKPFLCILIILSPVWSESSQYKKKISFFVRCTFNIYIKVCFDCQNQGLLSPKRCLQNAAKWVPSIAKM